MTVNDDTYISLPTVAIAIARLWVDCVSLLLLLFITGQAVKNDNTQLPI